jgi:DNA-directed RNA polymerase specialized sigma24 family protein
VTIRRHSELLAVLERDTEDWPRDRRAHVPIDDLEFREFFVGQFPALYWMGLLPPGDHGQAEELAQDALVRTYNRWKHVRRPDNPPQYARRVLINRHRSLLRRAVLEARHLASIRPQQPTTGLGRTGSRCGTRCAACPPVSGW